MVATLFRRQVELAGHGLAQAVAPEAEAGSDERQEQLEMSKMWRENEILTFWRENEILAFWRENEILAGKRNFGGKI
jgi:hypothetical protein